MTSDKNIAAHSLSADEITSERTLGRRSALGLLGVSAVGASVAAAIGLRSTQAHAQTSDTDAGPNADPRGHGRTGFTDRDGGANADGPGHGVCRGRGHTDSDTGASADGARQGRGPCHN